MKELTLLIKEVHPDACKLNARFLFRLIFRSPEDGQLLTRELGKVSNNPNHAISHTPAPKRGNRVIADIPDPDRTLQDSDFIQGDYLDVAIYYSRNN